MKKAFIFRGIFVNPNVFYGEKTDEEKKAEAIKAVKDEALNQCKEKLPEMIKQGMESDEVQKAIEIIFEKALAKAEIKAKDFDGTEKTIAEIFKSLQDQHDALAQAFQSKGGSEKGTYIEFVEKNIAENKDIAGDKNYSKTMIIKSAHLMNEVRKDPALMTTANVKPNVVGGYSPLFGNFIDTEIGHVPKPENVILPLITVKNQPGTESIWFTDRINEEGDAEFIAEGALKPLADAEWQTTKQPIKEVALRWKFTKRLMNHAPAVVADFTEHAYELVEQKIDDGALAGTGVGEELQGIQSVAAAFIVPPQLAGYYERVNIYDVINAMATRIRLSNFKGEITAVLNTVWEAKMMGIKDSEGRYITPEFVTPDGHKVGSSTVVFSNKIDDDFILIGNLKKFVLVMAEGIEYDEGYENDDFSKNLVSRKLEAFMGTYIKASDAGSILYDNIASVMDDIGVVIV